MSTVERSIESNGRNGKQPPHNGRELHRLAAVRKQEGISRRTVARRLHCEPAEVRRQEDSTADLPISKLYDWQQALDVPAAELLVESDDALSGPLMRRAQLIRVMKTVQAIRERAEEEPVRLMAQELVDQLVDLMPELRGVSAWNTVGKRRSLDELGVAAQRGLSDDVFIGLTE